MARISICWKSGELTAEIGNSPSAKKLLSELPIQCVANTWGDEVYFEVPFASQLESGAQQVVEPGTVCFWTQGNSIALPFGPTPIAKDKECRLADASNVIGKIEGDPRQLQTVSEGDVISLKRL